MTPQVSRPLSLDETVTSLHHVYARGSQLSIVPPLSVAIFWRSSIFFALLNVTRRSGEAYTRMVIVRKNRHPGAVVTSTPSMNGTMIWTLSSLRECLIGSGAPFSA